MSFALKNTVGSKSARAQVSRKSTVVTKAALAPTTKVTSSYFHAD